MQTQRHPSVLFKTAKHSADSLALVSLPKNWNACIAANPAAIDQPISTDVEMHCHCGLVFDEHHLSPLPGQAKRGADAVALVAAEEVANAGLAAVRAAIGFSGVRGLAVNGRVCEAVGFLIGRDPLDVHHKLPGVALLLQRVVLIGEVRECLHICTICMLMMCLLLMWPGLMN